MTVRQQTREFQYLHWLPSICIAGLLLLTFRLYGFAQFWLDDFANLYWVQRESFWEMLGHLLNPASRFFRPAGMFLYWIALHLFDRNPAGYHWLLWGIHTLNVVLVFWILKRFTGSKAGAYLGAALFASQSAFGDIYFSFGTIFEVAGAALYFSGILIWCRENRSMRDVLLASFVFLLALKAKEMAITLPAVWLGCDVLIRSKRPGTILKHMILPAAIGGWYGLQRLLEMHGSQPQDPYYLEVTSLMLGRGFGEYFNRLFLTEWRWQIWAIGFVFVLLVFAVTRSKLAFFFQAYIFVAFLPVIFLPNHREFFYWYFPMFGICGLAALMARAVAGISMRHLPASAIVPLATLSFAALCAGCYLLTRNLTLERRDWQADVAREYQAFVQGMQSLPAPQADEVLYFSSTPRLFSDETLLYACQVALRRTDIGTKSVETFPADARYRLGFEDSEIVIEP